MCVCVCVCVCERAHACTFMCVRACYVREWSFSLRVYVLTDCVVSLNYYIHVDKCITNLLL